MSHESARYDFKNKPADYAALATELRALLADEKDLIANAANATALIYHALPSLNWCGVYFLKEGELVVGPFQGKPACVRIALGKGVCGTAAATRKTIVVADVHAFPGHIACDAASRSEIVIPLHREPSIAGRLREQEAGPSDAGRLGGDGPQHIGVDLIGVLDLDSPILARFDDEDRAGLETLAEILVKSVAR